MEDVQSIIAVIYYCNQVQNRKSPGLDGYPSEFFKKIKIKNATELAPILLSAKCKNAAKTNQGNTHMKHGT